MVLATGNHILNMPKTEAQKKSLVFVKLTDSSLEAIEQYLMQMNLTDTKPTIQFNNDSGTISVPTDNNGSCAKFTFSLGPADVGGSFEGLQESKPLQFNKPGRLDSMCQIKDKLTVQASDASYQTFGRKMVELKKDNEKHTTMLINRPGAPKASGKSLATQKTSFEDLLQKAKQNLPPGVKPSDTFPVRRATLERFPSSFAKVQCKNSNNVPAKQITSNPNAISNQQKFTQNMASVQSSVMAKPIQKSMSLPKLQQNKNTEVMKRPLRERIIHLLAIRPLKKLEIVSRISRDGLREKDRNSITIILKQVSVLRDNTHHLMQHVWNEVSEDWTFYTDDERQSFRQAKPDSMTPPLSLDSSSESSSSNVVKPASLKRPSDCDLILGDSDLTGPIPKKIRVSNFTKPTTSVEIQSKDYINEDEGAISFKVNNWLKANKDNSQSASDSHLTPQSSPDGQEMKSSTVDLVMDTYSAKDYLVEFTQIGSASQRHLYKSKFNKLYLEYEKLHKYMDQVSIKFTNLETEMNQLEEGSQIRREMKVKIWNEYLNLKNDPSYIKTRNEFYYLHQKLNHIKMMVQEYDDKIF